MANKEGQDLAAFRFALEKQEPRIGPGGVTRGASAVEFPVSKASSACPCASSLAVCASCTGTPTRQSGPTWSQAAAALRYCILAVMRRPTILDRVPYGTSRGVTATRYRDSVLLNATLPLLR